MSYGERLKFIRKFRGMTQEELGKACNFGKNGHIFIAQYERGVRVPKKERNEIIAKALGVNPKVLMWNMDFPHEDIFFQMCWAFILPMSKYPLCLMDEIMAAMKIFLDEYDLVSLGKLSEMEYINNKIQLMNGIEKNTEV